MTKLLSAILLSTTLFATPALLAEMVNLNKASAAALQENLKGVGEKKAKAIVEYRKEFGDFKTLEEIKEVKGIGEGIFRKIKADLSLSKGVTDLIENASEKMPEKGVKKKTGQSKAGEAADKTTSSEKDQQKNTKTTRSAGNRQNS